jgi:MFS family permease
VRFLTGLGIGGEWAAGAALVAEALPDRARAGASSFIQSAAAVGPILAAIVGLLLKDQHWQWMFVAGIIPALLCVWIRTGIKEPEVSRKAIANTGSPIRELFSTPETRRNVLVAMVIGVVGVAGAGTATYWAPNLVTAVSQGLSDPEIASRKTWVTMISHLGTLLGVIVVPQLCKAIGRKKTILFFFIGAPLALLIGLQKPTYQSLLAFMPFVNFFAIGVSAAFVLYFPELFPSRMRATGAGMAYNTGRLFAVPLTLATGALVDYFGGPLKGGVATAVIVTASIYVIGILAIPFAPETRGKLLPE